jgi:4a-hydroxytetrahydrobiopterin dehydratase
MSELNAASCVPCKGGVPALAEAEIKQLLVEVPGWKLSEVSGIKRISREFDLPNFVAAMELAVRVGALAEEEQHHPDLHVAWGKLGVELWTHKIKGLHRNDFVLAAKINQLLEPQG